MITPENIFNTHYQGIVNPDTPIIVEYGWIHEGLLAYELSRKIDGTTYGVTVLFLMPTREIIEQSQWRFAGPEKWARAHINDLKNNDEYLVKTKI